MPRLRRRTFLTAAATAGAASQLPTNPQVAHAAPVTASPPLATTHRLDGGVRLRWLEGTPPAVAGTTFGVPWPRGSLAKGQPLSLTASSGEAVAVQSWPTGFWPDGSVKWTAHAVGTEVTPAEEYLLEPGAPVEPANPLTVTEDRRTVTVDTGTIRCRIAKRGRVLGRSIQRSDRTIATGGTLVCLRKDAPAEPDAGTVRQQSFTGEVRKVRVEQRGPVNSARTIAAQPNGFVQGSGLYNLATGEFALDEPRVSVGSLGSVFGLVEMCSELIDLLDLPEFTEAWLQYCRLYNGTPEEQEAETGQSFGNLNLRQAHSRLTAYAAARTGNAGLAARAWQEFYSGHAGYPRNLDWRTERVEPPAVLKPIDEASFASTNASSQYGLAAIQCLALVGDHLP